MRFELIERVRELRAGRTPFVVATVVRVAKPASAHPGDSAIVLPDGTIEGFVGGMCSESTVRTQGLRQLASGRSVLLHITPPAQASVVDADPGPAELGMPFVGAFPAHPDTEDEVTVGNPCLSGGALDIFLEVMRPPALVHVYGDTPVARALTAVGRAAGADVRPTTNAGEAIPPDATAVVVASQGGDEHRVLTMALRAGVPYIGLVASRRRGAAVLDGLGLDAEERARVHTPAGLDIGAQSPGEVAVSIVAEIIGVAGALLARGTTPGTPAWGDQSSHTPPGAGSHAPEETIDPVCGMTVAITESAIYVETQEGRVHFCCPSCRDAFAADPGRYTRTL
jgi:xanthine dehydrogenase accessory factor